MQYEYFVAVKEVPRFSKLERFGSYLQVELNHQPYAPQEAGWELWQTHVLNDAAAVGEYAVNGFIFVYRRPKP